MPERIVCERAMPITHKCHEQRTNSINYNDFSSMFVCHIGRYDRFCFFRRHLEVRMDGTNGRSTREWTYDCCVGSGYQALNCDNGRSVAQILWILHRNSPKWNEVHENNERIQSVSQFVKYSWLFLFASTCSHAYIMHNFIASQKMSFNLLLIFIPGAIVSSMCISTTISIGWMLPFPRMDNFDNLFNLVRHSGTAFSSLSDKYQI